MTGKEAEEARPGEGHDAAMPEDPALGQMMSDQDEEAVEYAKEFLKKVLRLRGVRIERTDFLKQELRKLALSQDQIERAIATTPVQAGLTLPQLDVLADKTIAFETNKSASASFIAGIPGGLAMLASVPGDLVQYYVHAFRIMQKLAYLYGWKELLSGMDEVDDETLGKLSIFLGVMLGVGGAAQSLTTFATQVARPALQKQIAGTALTKTAWYGPMKQVLKMVGIKVTKDSFAKTVTKVVPVAGGVISGGMTFVSLRSQSSRLKDHLRRIPPPGVDAQQYFLALTEADAEKEAIHAEKLSAKVIDGASQGAKNLGRGAQDAASAGAAEAKKLAGRLFSRKKSTSEGDEGTDPAE